LKGEIESSDNALKHILVLFPLFSFFRRKRRLERNNLCCNDFI